MLDLKPGDVIQVLAPYRNEVSAPLEVFLLLREDVGEPPREKLFAFWLVKPLFKAPRWSFFRCLIANKQVVRLGHVDLSPDVLNEWAEL